MIIFNIADKITAKIDRPNNFSEVVETLKQFKSKYNPSARVWEVPPFRLRELCDDLEEREPYIIENEDKLQDLLSPPSGIAFSRFPLDKSQLKAQPILGKSPYEHYQIEDIQKTVNRNRFALFLDVGTGKSYIILSAIHLFLKQNKINKILYLTSSTGVYDIVEKFEQFTDISHDKIAIGGVNNRRPFDSDPQVVVCNYRSFLLVSDEYQKDRERRKGVKTKNYRTTPIPFEKWLGNQRALVVLDESHSIAIPTSRQTKAIHLIKDFFYYRYILTGTPADTEEKYYSQLAFLDESLVKGLNFDEWKDYYCNLGNRFSAYAIESFKPDKLIELQNIVKGICSRRLASDVLVLPPNHHFDLYTDLTDNHREIYEGLVTYFLKKKVQAMKYDPSEIVRSFPSLIMAIDNPLAIKTDEIDDIELICKIKKFKFKHHSKLEVLNSIIDQHEGSKIVIWTSHPSVGFELGKYLEKHNPLVINGEVPVPPKMAKDEFKRSFVKEFTTDKSRNILISGIQVLNTAITMTEANVQVYFDTNFNYTETEQSEARIYRISQTKDVYTYNIICRNSLDVIRRESLRNKDFINDHFLSKRYIDQKMLEQMFGGKI